MKYVPYFIIVIVVYMFIGKIFSKTYTIPDEALRVRVIANSNDDYDQEVKSNVKDIVTTDMYELLKDVDTVSSAREIINNNLSSLDSDINSYLNKINYNLGYKINFGYNYFPKKEYKGVIYNEGEYESLVVTLGKGEGDNWWCVLFPPICMIEGSSSDTYEYTTLVSDIMNKYF